MRNELRQMPGKRIFTASGIRGRETVVNSCYRAYDPYTTIYFGRCKIGSLRKEHFFVWHRFYWFFTMHTCFLTEAFPIRNEVKRSVYERDRIREAYTLYNRKKTEVNVKCGQFLGCRSSILTWFIFKSKYIFRETVVALNNFCNNYYVGICAILSLKNLSFGRFSMQYLDKNASLTWLVYI